MDKLNVRRRGLLSAAAAALAGLALVRGSRAEAAPEAPDWREHFATLEQGAILVDLRERVLHFWPAGEEAAARAHRIAVPAAREFSRLGDTRVMRKVEGPTWRPTPAMRERNPSLPASLPPGPGNPFGSHALHLGWDHYRIHGTDDEARIGGVAPFGCIGLTNAEMADLFARVRVGTPVRLI